MSDSEPEVLPKRKLRKLKPKSPLLDDESIESPLPQTSTEKI